MTFYKKDAFALLHGRGVTASLVEEKRGRPSRARNVRHSTRPKRRAQPSFTATLDVLSSAGRYMIQRNPS